MSHGEQQLWAMLDQAGEMHFGEAQQALMEDVIRHADAGGLPRLAFSARRSLANAYSVDRQWDKAFPLFSRCLNEYDQRPGEFGPAEDRSLRHWYTNITQSMAEFPEISLAQIYGACDDMERRFRAGGHSLSEVHNARRWIAQVACDWDEEERCYLQWVAAGGPDPGSVWDFEAELERLVLRGDPASEARALELAAPALDGRIEFYEPAAPVLCLMLMPLARAGRLDEAASAYRRADRDLEKGVYRYEYSSMQIEFCALTGNEDAGLAEFRSRVHGFTTLNRPTGKMEFATASAILMGRLVATGRGAELIACSCGEHPAVPAATLRDTMTRTALEIAALLDSRNGTTGQGDRVRARLAAEPATDFVALSPTGRRRAPLADLRGLSPEQALDRAEWHERVDESDIANAYLGAVGDPAPPHLAARVTELRAHLAGGSGDEGALRWAAEGHRRAGDVRRYLLCMSRLGQWLNDHGRIEEGTAMVTWAAGELRASGDAWAAAWGELYLAQELRVTMKPGAFEAMQRAAGFALASGDPQPLGIIAHVDSYWREHEQADPRLVIDLATRAVDALIAAGASYGVLSGLERLRTAHERAGTMAAYGEQVRSRLDTLPEDAPLLVRARLRYERGRATLAAGRPSDAIDDLTEGVAQAAAHKRDRADQWYLLAAACHSVGRYEDAVNAAEQGAEWLENIRRAGDLDDPGMAGRCRLILADSRARLGAIDAALDDYVTLIDGAREFNDRAMAAAGLYNLAEVLASTGRTGEAAELFKDAGTTSTALGDAPKAVHAHCAEALAWSAAGNPAESTAAISRAKKAVKRIPTKPAPTRAAAQSHIDQTEARIHATTHQTPTPAK